MSAGQPCWGAGGPRIFLRNGYYHAWRPLVPPGFVPSTWCSKMLPGYNGGACFLSDRDDRCQTSADAVWFHAPTEMGCLRLGNRSVASRAQWYVYANVEPPTERSFRCAGYFNLSMTYLESSDVPFVYGAYVPRLAPWSQAKLDRFVDAAFGRPRTAALAVSRCATASRREEYVRKLLDAGLRVDVYGHCRSAGWNVSSQRPPGFEEFAALVRSTYKLYLSFESNLCEDYVTEKAWVQALQFGAIPVVRGGRAISDYGRLLPPRSFIATDAFRSPEQLVRHLHQVVQNRTLFASYHSWRKRYRLLIHHNKSFYDSKQQEMFGICRLCEYLRAQIPAASPRYPESGASWLPNRQLNPTFFERRSQCHPARDLAPPPGRKMGKPKRNGKR
jgi:hypothetical protein